MPSHLRDLELEEVSLVDRPANKGARVTLMKREVESPREMLLKALEVSGLSKEDAAKILQEEPMTDVEKKAQEEALAKIAALEAEKVEMAKTLKTKEEELAAAAAKEKEMAAKSATPVELDAVTKKLEAEVAKAEELKAKVAKLEEKEAITKIEAELADLSKVAKVADLAPIVKKFRETDKAAMDSMLTLIKSLAAQVAEGKLFKVLGKDGEGDSTTKLDTLAKALMEKDSTLTFEQAFTKALETKEGREAYAQEREGGK